MFKIIKKYHITHILIIISLVLLFSFGIEAYITTYGDYVSTFNNQSGISNDVVYVNDAQSDYDYYMGLNYTHSTDGKLPTMEDKHIYTDNNLVEVALTYRANDIEQANQAYVSLTERQTTYVYYKVYAINTNNTENKDDDYVTIELIDNPYTDRPTDKGFNGWITNYISAHITYDNDTYTRYVKIPITYTQDKPNKIEIELYASWIDANVQYISQTSTISNAINNLNKKGLFQLSGRKPIYESVSNYYIKQTIEQYDRYPNGAVSSTGGNLRFWCFDENGCTYYIRPSSQAYDESNTYYKLINGNMTETEVEITGYEDLGSIPLDTPIYGYFREKNIAYQSSYAGYYKKDATYQTSGTCNKQSGCTYYELIQYYDEDGTIETAKEDTSYYYLVTRDTNIIVLDTTTTNIWTNGQNKPFTLTSVHNKTSYINSATFEINQNTVNAYDDMTIENIKIYSRTTRTNGEVTPGSTRGSIFYGNWHNVKLGRGITAYSATYTNFGSIVGGNTTSTGSSSNLTRYKLIIESGYYNSIALTAGGSGRTIYTNAIGIYGNDYDRVTNNNDLLDIRHCASGSWGGTIYSQSNIDVALHTYIKSGKFGSNKYDYATGIYVGGRNGGTHHAPRSITVEGGYIYNLIGGPLTSQNQSEYNDTYIYIKGGSIDIVIGGAGRTETYGNRIIQMSGGQVNYSIFGGSNGITGSNSSNEQGTIDGDTLVYVGGSAIVGDEELVNNDAIESESQVESGSVFGIGNGKGNYEKIGSANNSNVIIATDAIIRRNVYAGGNYGAVGINSSSPTSTSNIYIKGGLIKGSVYGGGNNNGSGSTNVNSSVNIDMTSGIINGSLYGGSNQRGIIYGSVSINVTGGIIKTSVYGGGQGGYTSSQSQGTFVSKEIEVTIGKSDITPGPTIHNNVYGGSAYGSVNGTTNSSIISNYNTKVNVNSGTVEGSVYGGGQGNDTYTPYVMGNIDVNINGGTINNVFGGNDAAGTPNGYVKVYLNGGTVNNTYGGGNKTGITTTNVYLQGGTSTNIYGGSNQSGDVEESNIITQSGTADAIYGGNNQGGITNTSNITVNGGTIDTIYGGGKLATTNTTNIELNKTTINNVYGGGEAADVSTGTNITLKGSTVGNIYGGSNQSGTVEESNIITQSGTVNTIYGGNNQGGTTKTTNIKVDGANINTIYGGGDKANTTTSNITVTSTQNKINNIFGGGNAASVDKSNITVNSGQAENIYGGSNKSGDVTNSNIDILQTENNNTTQIVANVTWEANDAEPWQSTTYKTIAKVKVELTNNTQATLDTWDLTLNIPESILFTNYTSSNIDVTDSTYKINQVNKYYGNNTISAQGTHTIEFEVLSMIPKEDFDIGYIFESTPYKYSVPFKTYIANIYGGNNQGGTTQNTDIYVKDALIGNIYGGGNAAPSGNTKIYLENSTVKDEIYGGGNQASVNNNTDVDIINATINGSIFGGGNAGTVEGSTNLYISNTTVLESAYAGGNGITAIVKGNTLVNIDGTSNIGKHVFGGGNAAATGNENQNTSNSIVNIAGATIDGNVYGGANTSVINGCANVNIGIDAVTESNLIKGNIDIKGTVFGGGEANAGGSQIFDWSFISVTDGINVLIDGNNHDTFNIGTSIFGSGNASSSAGISNVTIKNYGTIDDYKKNISIQRATNVTIDNSAIELEGIADRTNELFSDVPFTIARVDELKIKNNTTLFLQTNTNLLKAFTSLVDVYDESTNTYKEEVAKVTINNETNEINSNVTNRLYIWESKNVNVLLDIAGTSYGKVTGMTFFGMFNHDRNGNVVTGMYSKDYTNGSEISSNVLSYFSDGAYVMGLHAVNHDIKIDGFYTNYKDENDFKHIKVDYIKPTSLGDNCYKWVVGAPVLAYEIEDLKASKYSTLGTVELPLIDFSDPNTKFYIEGFAYNELDPTISLIDSKDIPRIASDTTIADTVMSLVMESSNVGWITKGTTTFKTDGNIPSGTLEYESENSNTIPTLLFYLYHSKNLNTTARLGKVKISVRVETPINEISSKFTDLNIIINLSRALINTNDYEGAITAGKKYEMFANTATNITTKSSFSTYFSLYVESNNFYAEGYHRSLISNYILPKNTKITMIDYANSGVPEYYYYIVSEEDVAYAAIEYNQYNEVSYNLSKFIKMGSSNTENHYNDALANSNYYDSTTQTATEEFIFIVDYSDANITEDKTNLYLLLELRNNNSQVLVSVLAQQQNIMYYNLYYDSDGIIDIDAQLSSKNLYLGHSTTLNVTTDFIQSTNQSVNIYDTSYFDKKLGIKLSIYDEHNNQVSGADLLGVTFKYRNTTYHPRLDGTVRFNLAPKVANVSSSIVIDTKNSNLASGKYTIKIESFASPDGIYYGLIASDVVELNLNIVDTIYGLKSTIKEEMLIIDKDTGLTLFDNNALVVNFEYSSGLTNPNIRVSLYRRDYQAITTNLYNKVNLKDYITNTYDETDTEYEYYLTKNPTSSFNTYFYLKPNLTTGTYKLQFSLYDGNVYVGDVYQYIIIK